MPEYNYDPMTGEKLNTAVPAWSPGKEQESTPEGTGLPSEPAAAAEAARTPTPPQPRPRFLASFEEKLAAFLMFIPAYFYAKMIGDGLIHELDPMWRVDLAVFLLGTIGLTVFLFLKEKHRFESLIFFVCLGLTGVSTVFNLGSVWEDYQKLLFIHGFLLYWILSFSDRLSKGESSSLLLLDAVNVLFIVPFRNYFCRIRTIGAAFRDGAVSRKQTEEGGGEVKKRRNAVLWTLLAAAAAGILFPIAVALLSKADQNFADLVQNISQVFGDWKWGRHIGYFFMSLPVGAYVYGVLGGFRRTPAQRIRERGNAFARGLEKLRQVPPAAWAVLVMLFSAVYTVFFVLQWNWVIDAFRGICPADPRTYARESFFALLWVSLINFLLLGITHNSARDLQKKSIVLTGAKILLLLDNMVFCVISFSKICLYIMVHGFTPLRLQSSWLVVSLFLACIAAVIYILSGKKTMKYWMIASSLLLCGLTVF